MNACEGTVIFRPQSHLPRTLDHMRDILARSSQLNWQRPFHFFLREHILDKDEGCLAFREGMQNNIFKKSNYLISTIS